MAAQPAQDVAESSTQGEQNVQPNMTKKRRRNVKTGCITCRIRKVKCDEAKPSCNRCISTGRKCDGYAPVVSRTSSTNVVVRSSILTDARHLTPDMNDHEMYWLQAYRDDTSAAWTPGLLGDFWGHLLPQLSHYHPAIRHSLLTFSSAYANLKYRRAGVDQQQNKHLIVFELEQYNFAITQLRALTSDIGHELTLICCVLFVVIETIHGHRLRRMQHLRSGIKLMQSLTPQVRARSHDLLFVPQLLLRRTLIQSGPEAPMDLMEVGAAFLPPPAFFVRPWVFNSHIESLDALDKIVFLVSRFLRRLDRSPSTTQLTFTTPTAYSEDTTVQEQQQLLNVLSSWYQASTFILQGGGFGSRGGRPSLNPRTTTVPANAPTSNPRLTTIERDRILLLRIQHMATWITLTNALNRTEMSWDAFLDNFSSIVTWIDHLSFIAGADASSQPADAGVVGGAQAPKTWPLIILLAIVEPGITSALWLTATKCRHSWVRRHAVELLTKVPCQRRSGIVSLHARCARRVIELEEEGWVRDQDVPAEEARLSDVVILSELEGQEESVARARFVRSGTDGEVAVVWEEEIHGA